MKQLCADLFLKPEAFYAKLITKKESLLTPALIVLAAGIIAGVNAFLVSSVTAAMTAVIMPGMETIVVFFAFVGALLATLVMWAVWSAAIFAVSIAFKGKGPFKRTLEIVGYGYLPQVAGLLITSIAAYWYAPQVNVPVLSASSLQDPALIQEATKALMHDPAMMALTQITSVVSVAFLLWSATIWIFGLKHARSLPLRDAAVCVGLPVLVYIIYVLYMMTVM